MKRSAAFLALLPLSLAAQERAMLSCTAEGGEPFEVTLWNPSEFGAPLHCVNAPGLGDLAACAPDGGWGLTDPSRQKALLGIATRPGEAAAHEGAKLFAHRGPSEFVASASEGFGVPLALEVHGTTFWRMRVSLETGDGILETREGETAIRCERGQGLPAR